MARNLLADFLSPNPAWPELSADEISTLEFQNLVAELGKRIVGLPNAYTGKAGQLAVVNAAGTALVLVSAATEVDFAGKPVGGFKNRRPSLTGSASLTDDDHGGALVICRNTSSAITLSLAVTADPATGVSDGFRCQILRAHNAQAVTLSLGAGLTNRNPNLHTKIPAGRIADVLVDGTDVYFNGYTSA